MAAAHVKCAAVLRLESYATVKADAAVLGAKLEAKMTAAAARHELHMAHVRGVAQHGGWL